MHGTKLRNVLPATIKHWPVSSLITDKIRTLERSTAGKNAITCHKNETGRNPASACNAVGRKPGGPENLERALPPVLFLCDILFYEALRSLALFVICASINGFIFCSQVWFQNARAKWRRMVTKQESKLSDKLSPDASLELDMYHGPMGSIQSLPPHSPPYSVMGGPPSPNSMDCP